MTRYVLHAVPLLVLLLALFGFAVELLDVEPHGAVIRLALFDQPRVPAAVVLGTWLMESSGLLALYLLARGRCGTWWLDGLVAGWTAWIFRGPLLVITIVIAARQPQEPWWTLAFGWWVLYSICGLSLALLARRQEAGDKTAELARETATAAIEAPRQTPEDEAPSASDEVDKPAAGEAGEEPDEDTEELAEPPPVDEADEAEKPGETDEAGDEIYRRAAEER